MMTNIYNENILEIFSSAIRTTFNYIIDGERASIYILKILECLYIN